VRACSIGVVGATGAVGQELLKVLAERKFPTSTIRLLASARSAGKRITAMGSEFELQEANPNSFDGIDIAFFAAGGGVSKLLAPEAVKRGAIVVDKSSAWRMEPSVPLIIPEVNPADIDAHQGIISSPNCSTIVMLMALAPLHRANPLKSVVVDTYQSASGAGGKGINELILQTKAILGNNKPQHATFPHPLAFNVIPQVEEFTENGYTTEEIKMEAETQKILHLPGLPVSATCVRVPVTNSHSEAVHVGFTHPMTPEEAREILAKSPGVQVIDEIQRERYPMAPDASGKDAVFVGRIRKDQALENGLTFWTVGDNLRKGAALNACQIAEEALQREVLSPSQTRR
jgi:aspartate-semialdehyde dehydrogenase